jgi:branched-chain amino acid aminotransferase
MNSICLNGKTMPANEPALLAHNRGYRYGDGFFETMKVYKGKILLYDYHAERIFRSLAILKMEPPKLFTAEKFQTEIEQLCQKNNCTELARVRLSFFRGNGGLYDGDRTVQFLIECWPLNNSINEMNENGLVIDIYPEARKSCDVFSGIKSANFLPYTMAAEYAKENKLNDCIVLNTDGNIADTTIANIFLVSGDNIITPSNDQGCVQGVMRKYVLTKLKEHNYNVQERPVGIGDLEKADEVFLTNAVNGIRWVKQFRDTAYAKQVSASIYSRIIQTIFA